MKNIQKNAFGHIDVLARTNDCSILNIKHNAVQATVSLYGGQVLSWQPTGEREVFWLSQASEYSSGKAIRGGVPICWPWFGAYKDGGNHGFARQSIWQLSRTEILQDKVIIELQLAGENCHQLWPQSFRLTQVLTFGESFSQSLVIENTGKSDIRFSGALHNYFLVSDPQNVTVPDLSNSLFDDKLEQLTAQKDSLNHCLGPLDRVYQSSKPQRVVDAGWQRIIEINTTGCEQWVLWNPGKNIAEQMADIHVDGYKEYVCLEAANTSWVSILPNEQAVMNQTITIKAF